MNSFSLSYRDDWQKRENNKSQRVPVDETEHTRLIIDEDSIYEIDLDCVKCVEKKKQNYF